MRPSSVDPIHDRLPADLDHSSFPSRKEAMKPLHLGALLAALSCPMLAHADLALAKEKGCLICHAIDKKIVGPSYQEVAAKRTAADTDMLVLKVLKGGGGAYGTIRMPNNRDRGVSEDDAKKLVAWVLAQKK
jgi:cytochrome c